MSDRQYTYAVARIRAKEVSLFSQATLDQLLACSDEQQCLQFLVERGWGDADASLDVESILACEREKTWELMRELIEDMSVLDVLTYSDLFHNLKAAVKQVTTNEKFDNIFIPDTKISGEEMMEYIKAKEFGRFPDNMAHVAQEAYETLLHTGDGQLCDVIIDQATLKAIYEAGKASKEEIIKQYAESTVAVANIKIAVRSQKTAKSIEFMTKSMAECDTLNIRALAQAALSGAEAIQAYLESTAYAEGAEALAESPSAFECWCDNEIIRTIRPQIYNPFGIGPLVAYAIARENEIKTVRIILSGKTSDLSEESIRERVRDMYV
ncbi:V-type ATPase subunit [Lachnospiraceae bacterium OttesenSCG-928-E19]|nr:V-type ATPase subunit [Lachnospiraceae bacterium OttesenSCG-928-E19]